MGATAGHSHIVGRSCRRQHVDPGGHQLYRRTASAHIVHREHGIADEVQAIAEKELVVITVDVGTAISDGSADPRDDGRSRGHGHIDDCQASALGHAAHIGKRPAKRHSGRAFADIHEARRE